MLRRVGEQTVKSVRDHCEFLLNKRESVLRYLEKASGVEVDKNGKTQLFDAILEDRKDCIDRPTKERDEEKAAEELENQKVEDIRS